MNMGCATIFSRIHRWMTHERSPAGRSVNLEKPKSKESMTMSNLIKKTTVLAFALTSALALTACEVDKTQEGELPDVDVTAEGGQLPEYDVETPDVDVGTKTVPVAVPDIDVDMPEEGATEDDALGDGVDDTPEEKDAPPVE
jgi:hypothetical protein